MRELDRPLFTLILELFALDRIVSHQLNFRIEIGNFFFCDRDLVCGAIPLLFGVARFLGRKQDAIEI